MFKNILLIQLVRQNFNRPWDTVLTLLLLPLVWIFPMQRYLLPYAWGVQDVSQYVVLLKRIFMLLPILLIIIGCWCSMLTFYTLVFRQQRVLLMQVVFLTWWDSGRSIWMFWAGIFRFLLVLFVWVWEIGKMILTNVFIVVKQILTLPFRLMNRAGSRYFKPGVPWIAVMITFLWITVETIIFTYILTPTLTEVISDITGVENHFLFTPILFIFLFMLISGSFACIEVMVEAINSRNVKEIVQMAIIELFVMFFEVLFFYRELIDAISPWVAQQTGMQLGLFGTLILSSFGWLGIRGMTWFLFGRFGTPTLLSIIARKPMEGTGRASEKLPSGTDLDPLFWTREQIAHFKKEQEWFNDKARELLEALTLPPLQVLASIVNFIMVLISTRPLFNLPFKNLKEALDTKELIKLVEEKQDSAIIEKLKKSKGIS